MFDPKKTSFGRHETFSLRFSWLTKGYQAFKKDPDVFNSDGATIELGVGKNMVASIRYWLRACQIITPDSSSITNIGESIFNEETGFDPYLEDEATIWLLHWLLSTNSSVATSWYWFFNKYHKPEFTSEELATSLNDFVKDVIIEGKKPSIATLKNDSQLIHRMYTQSKGNGRTPMEDALDSPLALLRLMSQTAGGRRYISRPEIRPTLPLAVLGYALVEIMKERNLKSIPIEDLMYSRSVYCALGAVFRLTENDLVTKLEQLVTYLPDTFDIRDTAGIHQVFLINECSSLSFLHQHYKNTLEVVV